MMDTDTKKIQAVILTLGDGRVVKYSGPAQVDLDKEIYYC